jgi:transposase
MRTFSFPDEVRRRLARERFHHPDPCVQQRMEIVWLKCHGERHERIAELADASRSTVQRTLTRYAKGGLDALRTSDRESPTGALAEHRESLEAEFRDRPPRTVNEACRRIEELTGVQRKYTRVRLFLRDTLGLRWRKVGAVPVPPKLSVEEHAQKQAGFLKSGVGAAIGGGAEG